MQRCIFDSERYINVLFLIVVTHDIRYMDGKISLFVKSTYNRVEVIESQTDIRLSLHIYVNVVQNLIYGVVIYIITD
jgi:hypothetical protein